MSKLQVGDVFTSPTVGHAEHVVIHAVMGGGGYNTGDPIPWPDGWQLTVKQLSADGSYDPLAPEFHVYQSGCFRRELMLKDVVKVRRMLMTFVPE